MIQAYVFWHEPAAGVSAGAYEAALRAFHERLGAARPSGLLHSVAYRTDDAPWPREPDDGADAAAVGADASGGVETVAAYEDWYLIVDTASLDAIEAAATAPAAGPSHDSVARMAGRGAGGLYRLLDDERSRSAISLSGSIDASGMRPGAIDATDRDSAGGAGGAGGAGRAAGAAGADTCVWLDRPQGLSTADAVGALRAAIPAAAVWQRRLVLGPMAEFAVWTAGDESAEPPPGWTARPVRRTRITATPGFHAHAG